jgi:hypothetical protein
MSAAHLCKLVHNGVSYQVDTIRFSQISRRAKRLFLNSSAPLAITDSLPTESFRALVTSLDSPSLAISSVNPILLLASSLEWECPDYVAALENAILASNNHSLILSALHLPTPLTSNLSLLEHYCAFNFDSLADNPDFAKLPPYVLYRIFTWHSVDLSTHPRFFDFLVAVLDIHGEIASPLFQSVDFQSLPIESVISLVLDHHFDCDFLSVELGELLSQFETTVKDFDKRERELTALEQEKVRLEAELVEKTEALRVIEERLAANRELQKIEPIALDLDMRGGEEQLRALEQSKPVLLKDRKAAEAEFSQARRPWKLALGKYWKETERVEADEEGGLF